ncbi:MAG: class I SAM-dependent methyltransferase, partial [Xanthomonadales bacterium]|nr:class I SAM-dependent methyltransferase [Xanthomonadales bacterium]
CARSIGARRILELGASTGQSGCYLAASPACERFVTIEASPSLAGLARSHLGRFGDRAVVVEGFVEAELDKALGLLDGAVDLVYLDAVKDADGIVACVERLSPALRGGSLLILDDIRWSPGCRAGWAAVRRRAGVTTSIDLGRFGLCVWRGDPAAPAYADLSRYLGWFRIHAGR